MLKKVVSVSLLALAFSSTAIHAAEAPSATGYEIISPAQPTQHADKIEVIEFFWYGCPHCYHFEPTLEKWLKNLPKNVEFIRQPAAFTGTVGVKPTYGRCSRWGIVAFASSLDQAGPMARTVRDCAIMLKSMSGYDPKDSTSANLPVPDYEAAIGRSVKGLTIGIPKEYRIDGMPGEIDKLWQQGVAWLRDAGAEPVEISLPHTKLALPAYYIIAPAEASSNLAQILAIANEELPVRELIAIFEDVGSNGRVRVPPDKFGLKPVLATSPVIWAIPTGPAMETGAVPTNMLIIPFLNRTKVSMH